MLRADHVAAAVHRVHARPRAARSLRAVHAQRHTADRRARRGRSRVDRVGRRRLQRDRPSRNVGEDLGVQLVERHERGDRRDLGIEHVERGHRAATGVNSRCRRLEPAQHVDRRVLVAARAGRAVLAFGDPDVGHAVEDAFEAHARLGPGEGRTDTRVDAEPEPEVMAAVGAVEAELGRRLEVARVAVRGAVVHHHGRARREVDAADRRGEHVRAGTRLGSGSRAAASPR